MEMILTHLQDVWDRVAERIGDIQSRSGVVIEGRKLVRMISASIVGYCVEELKRGESIGETDREFFKEIFTAF
jgi:hypothetical protein